MLPLRVTDYSNIKCAMSARNSAQTSGPIGLNSRYGRAHIICRAILILGANSVPFSGVSGPAVGSPDRGVS
jgi:hypothetical protein